MDSRLIAFIVLPTIAYLVGSIPFGLLLGLQRGIDIRRLGSGNIGATNVGRVLGRPWGIFCFILDLVKGFIPVLAAGVYLWNHFKDANDSLTPEGQMAWLLVCAAAVLGHVFPVYLGFKGGKGVTTSLGGVLGIWPYFTLTVLISVIVWSVLWAKTRIVSLASIVAAAAFPIGFLLLVLAVPGWRLTALWPLLLFAIIVSSLIVIRHRSNIKRLLEGSEPATGGRQGPQREERLN